MQKKKLQQNCTCSNINYKSNYGESYVIGLSNIYAIDLFSNRDQKAEAKQTFSSLLWWRNKTFNCIGNKLKREEIETLQKSPGGKIMGGDEMAVDQTAVDEMAGDELAVV